MAAGTAYSSLSSKSTRSPIELRVICTVFLPSRRRGRARLCFGLAVEVAAGATSTVDRRRGRARLCLYPNNGDLPRPQADRTVRRRPRYVTTEQNTARLKGYGIDYQPCSSSVWAWCPVSSRPRLRNPSRGPAPRPRDPAGRRGHGGGRRGVRGVTAAGPPRGADTPRSAVDHGGDQPGGHAGALDGRRRRADRRSRLGSRRRAVTQLDIAAGSRGGLAVVLLAVEGSRSA